jgi:hypothetical protein
LFNIDILSLFNYNHLILLAIGLQNLGSKYKSIEHLLFPHVTCACQGVVFTNIERVKELIERTKTHKGLQFFINLIETIYETGPKVCESFKNKCR